MASSADGGEDGAATMSGAGGAAVGRAAAGEEEEVAGPAAAAAAAARCVADGAQKKTQRFRLRRVPLPQSSHARILGGQACLWTEYVPNEATAAYMLFPRLLATSESLWSPPLRERRAFSSPGSRGGGGDGGGEGDGGGQGDDGGESDEEKRATERAWRDFVSRARAQGPRLDAAGWTERRKL
jgi:hypothetical protein